MRRITRMIEKLQNIGEQKCVEEEFKLLQSIALEIAEAENFHDALSVVLRNLCEFTGWVYGEVWLPSPDKKYLECHMAWHTDSRELEEFREQGKKFTLPMGIGLPGHVWSSKKPVWVPDPIIYRDISCASVARDPSLKTAMGIPVIANDKVLAIIIFFVREQREEDERLVNLISSIVVQLGATIRRKQMEESLLESEQRIRSILDNTPTIVYVKDLQGRYTFVNNQFEELLHRKRDEIQGKTDHDLFPGQMAEIFQANDKKVIEAKTSMSFDEILLQNGDLHTYISMKFPLFDSTGTLNAICGISTDITERKRIEDERTRQREQLLHVQRLESLSKFAGNIAHDFNNILTAIIGYTELLQNKVKEDDSLNVYVQRILGTTERAAKLTQNLLMFSRRQNSNPKPVNLNMIIKCAEQIFLRLVSENIKLETSLTRKDCIIMADSGQIEQVLINLVMNAQDAMPHGGALTISTDSGEIDNEFVKTHGYGKTGKYAIIMVSDTGIGMDEETKKKIFEPFSTTRETGKGTGLGLAIVYGIVKQHQGYIHIDSKPGEGTICKIYLPLVEPEVEEKKPEVRDTVNK